MKGRGLLADVGLPPRGGKSLFGEVTPPPGVAKYGAGAGGFFLFLNNILKLLIYGAGLFALLNFILAGYGFLAANGEPERMNKAWAKIWQSLLGLVVAAGAFVIAGVVGYLVFGDYRAILEPKIYGPGR